MKSLNIPATLILALSFSTSSFADDGPETSPVPAGSRVRIETWDGRRIVGTLSSWGERAATVRNEGADKTLDIETSQIRFLDRSTSRRSHTGKGALIGALIGFAAPLVIVGGLAAAGDCDDCGLVDTALLATYYFGRFTIPVGAAVGAALGGSRATDTWEPVRLRESKSLALGLGLAPATGGASARVRVSWN